MLFPLASVRPKSEWRLSDAPISVRLKDKILAQVTRDSVDTSDAERRKYADEHATVKLVKLDGKGTMGIEVVGTDGWCGATGNCPVWIFDKKSRDLLVKDDGWDHGFRRTTHCGLFDFYMRANTSAGSGTRHEYQFEGKVYQRVKNYSGADY